MAILALAISPKMQNNAKAGWKQELNLFFLDKFWL